jgi:hypothetical protein
MTTASGHPIIAATKRQSEPEIAWRYAPRLEPGEYPAYCRSAKTYWDGHFKRWVCAVQFDVLGNDLKTKLGRVAWFLNLGNDQDKPRASRRSNYMSAWVLANGGPPRRGDRVSPRIFKRRYARVVVADTAKDFKQRAVSGQSSYSVIRTVLSWDTGGREL